MSELTKRGDETKERARERATAWYYANKEKVLSSRKMTTKKWRQEHPDKWAIQKWRGHLKHAYGITIEQYDQMVFDQGGLCAICKKLPHKIKGKTTRLQVDHDHETGEVRGLLCGTCNTALHKIEYDRKWSDAAHNYLNSADVMKWNKLKEKAK